MPIAGHPALAWAKGKLADGIIRRTYPENIDEH